MIQNLPVLSKEIKPSPAALAWIEESKNLKRCPVYKCRQIYRTRDGLGIHLFNDHIKARVIAVVLDLLGL